MPTHRPLLRPLVLALAAVLCASHAVAEGLGLRVGLPPPGIGTVFSRDKQRVRLQLDRDATVHAAQLIGRHLVVRAIARTVYLPQSWRELAHQCPEKGTLLVLPTDLTGGDLAAQLTWEDPRNPIKAGDRVEVCRIPPGAAKPLVLSLRVRRQHGPTPDPPAVNPGEEAWLEAQAICPTGVPPHCEWTTDLGDFVHAGGTAAGKSLAGPPLVRWRAPVAAAGPRKAAQQATIRLKVSVRPTGEAVEQTLVVRVQPPKGPYRKVQWTPTRITGLKDVSEGPLFSDASQLAAGPPGAFYLADTPARRLLYHSQAPPRYLPLGRSQVGALGSFAGEAHFVQAGSVLRWLGGPAAAAKVATAPTVGRLVGLQSNAAGDLYLLDSGAPPRLFVRAGAKTGPWQDAPLEPRVDSPWLASFAIDPLSNDAYILDTRNGMVRQWRALAASNYYPLDVPMHLGKSLAKSGPPADVLVRLDCDRSRDLAARVVFETGAVTETWTPEGSPPRWKPTVSRAPAQLRSIGFAVRRAVALPDGDILMGGQATVDRSKVAVVAQVSPAGELRRRLPLPGIAPRFVAVAPGGLRYLFLLRERWGKDTERLVVLGPDGWLVRDLGNLELCSSIKRVRADRSSPNHVFLVGEKRGRESAFRLDATDPTVLLELSSAGIPGRPIPEHEAVDVATSPAHVAVLDDDGKVLLFANAKPVKYLGQFETGLRRPRAIAVCSDVASDRAPEAGRRTYVCVLLSGRRAASIRLWAIRFDDGEPAATALGSFPAAAQLSSPLTMDTGFPDHQEMLYVLDGGGTQVRAFDVADIGFKLSRRLVPTIPAAPLIDKLPFKGDELDMAIGPAQTVHIVDTKSHAVHTYARRP